MKFEEANGFEIYQRYCLVCHGELGEGDGFNAFNLDPKPRSLVDEFMSTRVSDRELSEAVRLGGRERGKSPLMPAWGRTLGDRRIRYVVSYIRLLQQRARNSASPEASSAE
ncbi:MAG TPA: cytochrome c [Bryobacterales bacterium]|nr:cytochrome c [Bryobacterales bacterium]